MESVILKISHVLLLMLVCGIVFILIQDPYLIEKPKISLDVKQASANNIVVYENSDKLLCKYSASEWVHFVENKDEATNFVLDCENEQISAKNIHKNNDMINASYDVMYSDKVNQNLILTQNVDYDLKSKIIKNDIFTKIISKNNILECQDGFIYDKNNGTLDMKNIKMIIKDSK